MSAWRRRSAPVRGVVRSASACERSHVQRYLPICALALALALAACGAAAEPQAPAAAPPKAVVIVSANMEWRNLGTCGGFAGAIEKHAVVLADRTIIYDIKEAMGDSAEAIADYAVALDLSWLTGPPPSAVRKTLLVSADRDLVPAELGELKTRYGAIAGDWESGAIAYTCQRNRQRVLILRGVSDVVGSTGSEAYGNMAAFAEGADVVMRRLLGELPAWLARCP